MVLITSGIHMSGVVPGTAGPDQGTTLGAQRAPFLRTQRVRNRVSYLESNNFGYPSIKLFWYCRVLYDQLLNPK